MTDSLLSRVARLERQNRALKLGFVLASLGLVTCGAGITSNYEQVNTRVLVIQSADEVAQIRLENGMITFSRAGGDVTLDADSLAKLLANSSP